MQIVSSFFLREIKKRDFEMSSAENFTQSVKR